jgi:hypothetical protein
MRRKRRSKGRSRIAAPNVGSWIRTGLWALPIYGLLLSIVGLTIGVAQTLAAILIIVSGAWSTMREPSTGPTGAVQPRVS